MAHRKLRQPRDSFRSCGLLRTAFPEVPTALATRRWCWVSGPPSAHFGHLSGLVCAEQMLGMKQTCWPWTTEVRVPKLSTASATRTGSQLARHISPVGLGGRHFNHGTHNACLPLQTSIRQQQATSASR